MHRLCIRSLTIQSSESAKKTRRAHLMRASPRFLILKMYFHFHLHLHEYSVHGKEKIVYKALVVFQFQLKKLFIKYHKLLLIGIIFRSKLLAFSISHNLIIDYYLFKVGCFWVKFIEKLLLLAGRQKQESYKINVSWMVIEGLQSLERRVRYQLTYSSVPVRTTRAS